MKITEMNRKNILQWALWIKTAYCILKFVPYYLSETNVFWFILSFGVLMFRIACCIFINNVVSMIAIDTLDKKETKMRDTWDLLLHLALYLMLVM